MNKLFYYTFYSLVLITGATSCSKELSKLPENKIVSEEAIYNEATAKSALNGVYYRFANVGSSYNNTLFVNNAINPCMMAGYAGYGFGQLPLELNQNAGYSTIYWGNAYQIINSANGVIEGINALPPAVLSDTRKAQLLGEARFLRAYANTRLLYYYSEWFDSSSAHGVLIRDKVATVSNAAKARSTVKESYRFIMEDLNYAVANAPDSNANYYGTKWAAMALKMRVLLMHGLQNDYTTAIDLADKIMTSGRYVLENNMQDIFRSKGLSSKEVILGIKPQPNQDLVYYSTSRQFYPGASSLYTTTENLNTLLTGDPRKSWLIGSYRAAYKNYFFLKYIAEGSNPSITAETGYAFRLSEIYLLKAEAIARSGGSLNDAKALVKTVMGHTGVTNFAAIDNATDANAFLTQLYYEYVKNMLCEDGIEWMALLRFPLATITQLRPTITSTVQLYLPIPTTEFTSNPTIGDQNTGYDR